MKNTCQCSIYLRIVAIKVLFSLFALGLAFFGSIRYANEAAANALLSDNNLLHVKEFMNNAIPFWVGDAIPQFNTPNEISNDDLLNLLVMSDFTPKQHDQDEQWIQYISAEDVENTAKTIFGPDIKEVQHEDVHLFLYDSNNRLYSTRPVGGGIPHTKVHIIDIRETDNEYIVDAVHAYHSFNLYDMMDDPDLGIDIYDDWGNYVLTLDDFDDDYSAYLPYLPVRRYILTKTSDESYYLTQSYIVGINAPGGTQPIGNLNIGDRVLDSSWEWDFGFDAPLLKPVVWIVVAKDHYGEGSGVTLLSEGIIGHPIFDDSTVVSTFGNNHWGKSGTADASNGLRPWLNSKGIHKGEGFYEAFSQDFKNAVLERGIPCIEFEYDLNFASSNSCRTYISYDKVFIPSALELGGNPVATNCLDGNVFPFFDGAPTTARIASKGGSSFWYWTRTPSKDRCDILFGVDPEGNIKSTSEIIHTLGLTNMGHVATRVVVNIKSDTMVSSEPAANDIYVIDSNHVESNGNYYIDKTHIKGMPLTVNILSEFPLTPCSISVYNQTDSGVTERILGLGNRAVLRIEDTSKWPTGPANVTIAIGDQSYKKTINVFDQGSFNVIGSLEWLTDESQHTINRLARYPAFPLYSTIYSQISIPSTIQSFIEHYQDMETYFDNDVSQLESNLNIDVMQIPSLRPFWETRSTNYLDIQLEAFEDMNTAYTWLISEALYYQCFRFSPQNRNIINRHDNLIKEEELLSDLSFEELKRMHEIIRIGRSSIVNTERERIYHAPSGPKADEGRWQPTLPHLLHYQQYRGFNFTQLLLNEEFRWALVESLGVVSANIIDIMGGLGSDVVITPDQGRLADELYLHNSSAEMGAITPSGVLGTVSIINSIINLAENLSWYLGMYVGAWNLSESVDYKHALVFDALVGEISQQAYLKSVMQTEQKIRTQSLNRIDDLTIELSSDKANYNIYEKANLELLITNHGDNTYEDLIWWIINPHGDDLKLDTFNIDSNAQHMIEVEYEVMDESYHVLKGMVTSIDMTTIAETHCSFSVGESTAIGAILSVDTEKTYQAGDIEIDVLLENVGLETISNPVLVINDDEIELDDIEPGYELKHTINLHLNIPDTYSYSIKVKDSNEKMLDGTIAVFKIEAIGNLYAINTLDKYIFRPGEEIAITAKIMDEVWQETSIPYDLTIIAPDGEVIETVQFTASLEGVYSVEIIPAPAESEYLIFKDKFNLIVGSACALHIHQELHINESDEQLEVTVTNEYEQPVANVEVILGHDNWFTDQDGRVIIDLDNTEEIYLEARKFPYHMAAVRLISVVDQFAISVSAEPEEGGSVEGGGRYDFNEEVTVSVTANPGYEFVNWTENGTQVSADSTFIFTVTEDRNLVANFTEVSETDIKLGDVTGNGKVNVQDVTLVMQYALGLEALSDEQKEAADVNGDGIINVHDVVLIMQKVLGLIDKFPIQ